MTDEERYLFDLQGYLVLRGVLTQSRCFPQKRSAKGGRA